MLIFYTPAVEIVPVVIIVEFIAAVERDTKCNLFILFYLLTAHTGDATGLSTISKFSLFIHFFNIQPVSEGLTDSHSDKCPTLAPLDASVTCFIDDISRQFWLHLKSFPLSYNKYS